MYDAFTIRSPSPDRQHSAQLVIGGEIRFGPPYYSLSIDDYTFGERIFGDAHLWNPSSSLFAVQEWLTLDYSAGPITALVLIDVQLGREVTLAQVTKQFIIPEAFVDTNLVYRIDKGGKQSVQQGEIDITKIAQWKTLA